MPSYHPPLGWEERVVSEFIWLTATLQNEKIALYIVNDGSVERISGAFFAAISKDIFVINRDENRGKGFTLREGVSTAEAEKIIYTDIDFPYDRDSFLAVYKGLENSDVVIGVRAESYYYQMPKVRVWVSKTLRFLIRFFLQIPTDDTQCGLKGFNSKGKSVFLNTTIDRYLFDLEFVFLSARQNLRIEKINVMLREGVVLSKLNIRVLTTEFINFIKLFFRTVFSL